MKGRDLVERALLVLADEEPARQPDQALEHRLRAAHRPMKGPWPLRRLSLLVAVLGLSGAAAAASGAGEWIRSWWFVIDVGAQQQTLPLGAGERASVPFATADGSVGTIQVQRELGLDGAMRTQIQLDKSGNGKVEAESLDEYSGPKDWRRLPISALQDAVELHAGVDDLTGSFQFFASADQGSGSRLLLLQEQRSLMPVIEVARLPFDIMAPGASSEIVGLGQGVISLSLRDARGAVIEFRWNLRPDSLGAPDSELQSADGSVRVRVKNGRPQSVESDT